MQPWNEDDRFRAVFESQLFNEEKMKAAVDEAANMAKLLSVEPGAAIVDACCGRGGTASSSPGSAFA